MSFLPSFSKLSPTPATTPHRGFAVLEDPDGYHIQLLSSQIHQKLELEEACEGILALDAIQLKDFDGNPTGVVVARGGSPELRHAYWRGGSGAISPIEASFGDMGDTMRESSPASSGGNAASKRNSFANGGAKGKTTPDNPSQDR